jgi:hypothetical protein
MEELKIKGIDIDRVVNMSHSREEVICPICKNVFLDPVTCEKCENYFCLTCIQIWLKNSRNKCINRCEYNQKKVPPILNRLLSKLILTCENKENGCDEKINYDSIKSHVKSCEFRIEICVGCKQKFLKKDLLQHFVECEVIEIKCEICDKLLPKVEYFRMN